MRAASTGWPTAHLGPAATQMERRRGVKTRLGDENRAAENRNRDLAAMQAEQKGLDFAIEMEKRRLAEEREKARWARAPCPAAPPANESDQPRRGLGAPAY